jgi:predicted nucleic acid-binding protein
MTDAAIKRFVVDASVALAWCFPDEGSAGSEAILDSLTSSAEALVPCIWPHEVANALIAGERRKRITLAQITSALTILNALPIALDPIHTAHAFERILPLARQHQLSEYDASYLELALRETLPLATLDDALRRAAKNAGIALLKI